MNIPKYIDKLIERRKKLAIELNSADLQLGRWLEQNGVEVEECDISTGCEMYANPWAAANRILCAIRDK